MEQKFLTHDDFAKKINGREYGNEITKEEINQARENGLVMVYGSSDDLMEFVGAIEEEVNCLTGGYFRINSKNLKVKKGDVTSKNKIYADWNNRNKNASWCYDTEIHHSTFNIYEYGELYCIGIVFSIYDLH